MLIYQIIGFIGYIILLYSLWNNKKEKLLKYRVLGNIIIAIHYLLLGGIIGFITNIITAFRGIVYSNKNKKFFSKVIWVYIFIVIYIGMGIYNQTGIISILPAIGATVVSITLWKDNLKFIRLAFILEGIFWIIYAINAGSWSAIIIESILLISTMATLIKYDIKKLKIMEN